MTTTTRPAAKPHVGGKIKIKFRPQNHASSVDVEGFRPIVEHVANDRDRHSRVGGFVFPPPRRAAGGRSRQRRGRDRQRLGLTGLGPGKEERSSTAPSWGKDEKQACRNHDSNRSIASFCGIAAMHTKHTWRRRCTPRDTTRFLHLCGLQAHL